MLRILRRSRLFALTLLLATPALGGAWLQAVHPCPVDAPWLAAQGGHGGEHHGTPADASQGCHCVGSCSIAAGAPLAQPLETPVAITSTVGPPRSFAPRTHAPVLQPADRLPPATAPPLG
jgi:hypothetical protein